MIDRCTFHILSQTFNVFPIFVAGMPPLTTHAIELLYTPQDYDIKLLFQTWQHLIRADYRTFLESCDDPAALPTNPMTMTRLLNLDSEPPLTQPYYSSCNITAQFHVISKNTLNNNLFDRLLILSINIARILIP